MPCTIVNVAISHVRANGNVLCLYQLCYDSLDVLQVTFGCCVFVGVSGTLYSKNTKTVLSVQDTGAGGKQTLELTVWLARSSMRFLIKSKTNHISCFLVSVLHVQ